MSRQSSAADRSATSPTEASQAGAAIRRLIAFLRPHKRKFAATIALTVVVTAAALAVPYAFGEAINAIGDSKETLILVYGLVVIGAGLVGAFFEGWNNLVGGSLSLDVEMDVRDRIYSHVATLDATYFDRVRPGEIVSRILVASGPVRSFLGTGLPQLTQDVITVVLATALMLLISPLLTAVALWPVPISLFVAVRYARRVTPAVERSQARIADLTVEAETSLRGFERIKLAGAQHAWVHRFVLAARAYFAALVANARIVARYEPAIVVIPNLGMASLLVFGGYLVIQNELSLGGFVTFVGVLQVALNPIQASGSSLWSLQQATAASNRAYDVLDAAPEIVSRARAVTVGRDESHLGFVGISQDYATAGDALRHIELDIAGGRNVGILGGAGAGKSSLLSLVNRLYDPSEGDIRVGSHSARDVDLESLRNLVRYVGRNTPIFDGSVRDNLLYGNPDAAPEQVDAALDLVDAESFLAELPDGLDSPADSATITPARRQLIGLVRAVLTRPGILLLDDATADLSPEDEARTARALKTELSDTTIVAVVKRRSLIPLADDFVLLDGGEVAATGTLDEIADVSASFRSVLRKWRDTDIGSGVSR